MARDAAADGRFVYGVRSTGVFCRPSCPSRRPHRDHLTFYSSPDEAERAGFRPCKRCRPHEPAGADPWIDKIRLACRYLSRSTGHVSLAALAARIGGSPYHLQRTFKRIVGVTPRQYADACRFQHVREKLRARGTVTSAVFDAGYGSSSRFYERAAARLGMTPSTYRRGGAGMSIKYSIVDSPLGRLLVAATDRGLCFVGMASADAELERALAREYPSAGFAAGDKALAQWTAQIVAHLEGRRPQINLPVDVQATAFQWQVWKALESIPYGETRSYAEVASSIGRPRAFRAVARACATNPVALVIPCHRVVRSTGGLGGYGWGVARKKALLERERRAGRR
jgi:AraC family transcriptional regulator of adaptative response/methylated-DNA-[protein]-cysteine methyltransferase